jgi:ABC-type branched-subunit amino acid transport system ATPase component
MFYSQDASPKLAHAAAGRGLVMLPECRCLFPTPSVLENLELCAYHGEARAQIKHHLDEVMEFFPILVEQNVRNALQMCQRGYVIEHGHLLKTGSGSQLLADPDVQRSYMGL